MIEFTVHGVPAPQGSKTAWGTEANPNTRPWRAAVAAAAVDAMDGRPLLIGPVEIQAVFYFSRPKSHYRTGKNAHILKDSAPAFVASKPDLDKLLRALGDALTGTLLRDDAQVVVWYAYKRYDQPARATIRVAELATRTLLEHKDAAA